MKKLIALLVLVLLCGVVRTANSALIDRGGGLIYDTDYDITWLQDANYAYTSGYWDSLNPDEWLTGGEMTWDQAMDWAGQLVYHGQNNWRLPDSYNQDGSGPDGPYNATGSEMGHLYYTELGNPVYGPLTYTGPFINLQPYINGYPFIQWSATEAADSNEVWMFDFSSGGQGDVAKINHNYAWAVHDGDIGAVPIPSAVWLLGSAFIGLVRFRKKFRKES